MIYAENILICIATPLLITMFFVRGHVKRFVAAFLLGMSMCLLAAYISGFASVRSGLGAEDTAIFISPIVEEIMKLLPILFFLFMFSPEDESLLPLAAGIGAGFATFENCCYILSFGAESLPFILVRGIAVGVMHIVSTLAVTLAIMMARRYHTLSLAGILGALAASMTFHGLYNLLVSRSGVTAAIGFAMPLVLAAVLYFIYGGVLKDNTE